MSLSETSVSELNTAAALAEGMPFYSEPPASMPLRDRALHYARQHREIHLAWLDYWAKNPPDIPELIAEQETLGGVEHQEMCVAHYDTIIAALEASK